MNMASRDADEDDTTLDEPLRDRDLGVRLALVEQRLRSHEALAAERHKDVVHDLRDVRAAVAASATEAKDAIDAHAVETRATLKEINTTLWKVAVVVGIIAGALGLGGQVMGQLVGGP